MYINIKKITNKYAKTQLYKIIYYKKVLKISKKRRYLDDDNHIQLVFYLFFIFIINKNNKD